MKNDNSDLDTTNIIDEMIGVTIKKITRDEIDRDYFTSEALTFEAVNGRSFVFFHKQDCCEAVWIEDIVGDLSDLEGSPIVRAEERIHIPTNPLNEEGEKVSETYTFYEFATLKGSVTVRWYGRSNGYYSERVDFLVRTPGDRDCVISVDDWARDCFKLRNKFDLVVNRQTREIARLVAEFFYDRDERPKVHPVIDRYDVTDACITLSRDTALSTGWISTGWNSGEVDQTKLVLRILDGLSPLSEEERTSAIYIGDCHCDVLTNVQKKSPVENRTMTYEESCRTFFLSQSEAAESNGRNPSIFIGLTGSRIERNGRSLEAWTDEIFTTPHWATDFACGIMVL